MSRIDASNLLERYCVVKNLQSPAGKCLNEKACLVVKVDERDSSRVGVIFVDQLSFYASKRSEFVSLKPENLEPLYEVCVRDSKLGGKGLFTTRAFSKGEILLVEKPFVMAPSLEDVPVFVDKFLSEADREALACLTLADPSHLPKPLGGSEWVRRFANNCISCEVDLDRLPKEVLVGTNAASATGTKSMMALFPVICRANHSCFLTTPNNTRWAWDRDRGVQYLTATRDIPEGAEVIVDYISDVVFGEERVENLAVHGIVGCVCAACRPHSVRVGSGSATVARRMDQYGTIKHKLATDAGAVERAARRKAKMSGKDEDAEVVLAFEKLVADGTAILEEVEVASGVPDAMINLKAQLLLNQFQNLANALKSSGANSSDIVVGAMRNVARRSRDVRSSAVGQNTNHPYLAPATQMENALQRFNGERSKPT